MLQHINLLPKKVERNRPHLNGRTVWVYSLFLCLIMAFGVFWSYFDHQSMLSLANKTEKNYQRLVSQYEATNTQLLAEIGGEGGTLEAKKKIELEIEKNKKILEILKTDHDQDVDIPLYLAIFQDHGIDNLILAKIAFAKNGRLIKLEAQGGNSTAMTQYLTYLESTDIFNSFSFSLVSYHQDAVTGESIFELMCRHKALPYAEGSNQIIESVERKFERYFLN